MKPVRRLLSSMDEGRVKRELSVWAQKTGEAQEEGQEDDDDARKEKASDISMDTSA